MRPVISPLHPADFPPALLLLLIAVAGLAFVAPLRGAGIFEDGASARTKALAGASVSGAQGPVDALAANPAELSNLAGGRFEAGASAGFVQGDLWNRANRDSTMHDFGIVPNAALSYLLGPVTLGIGFIPDSTLRANWRYRDAPGGLDGATSYGVRQHDSEIQLLRFAMGASYAITPELSLGAGVGLLYNRNRLAAPYIVQAQPQLRGAKVLLDLETDGWGPNAQFGLAWKPVPSLQVGLSYTLQSRIKSRGRATVEGNRQLENLGVTGVETDFDANAEVTNTFPQILSLGATWAATSRLKLVGQLDWINWADAFETLDVRLRRINNPLYRSLLADRGNLDDEAPLQWRDQWVLRGGLEFALTPAWTARAGYRYARNPVPGETLTPLTAVINRHLVSAGLGYEKNALSVDLGWQWLLPEREENGRSELLTGEYSNSTTKISAHWLSLSAQVKF